MAVGFLFIMYAITYSSILSDIIYKTVGSSNNATDKGATDKKDVADKEQESHEIEEELEHIDELKKKFMLLGVQIEDFLNLKRIIIDT